MWRRVEDLWVHSYCKEWLQSLWISAWSLLQGFVSLINICNIHHLNHKEVMCNFTITTKLQYAEYYLNFMKTRNVENTWYCKWWHVRPVSITINFEFQLMDAWTSQQLKGKETDKNIVYYKKRSVHTYHQVTITENALRKRVSTCLTHESLA